ncbi:MAG: AAA family ATPase, partial [Saprospiraceae bacterium]
GAPASGKMTIGQELVKLTDFKLFFNHMSLDLVYKFFDFGTEPFIRLDDLIRFAFFKEIAKSDLKGLVFTAAIAYDKPDDIEYTYQIVEIFKAQNAKVGLVSLDTTLEERLKRNKTANRLKHKPLKRDLEFSEQLLLNANTKHRQVYQEGDLEGIDILKIENTNISAKETALMIKNHFEL